MLLARSSYYCHVPFLCIRHKFQKPVSIHYIALEITIFCLPSCLSHSLFIQSQVEWMFLYFFFFLLLILPDLTMYLYIFWITHVLWIPSKNLFYLLLLRKSLFHIFPFVLWKKNCTTYSEARVNANKMMMTTKLKILSPIFLLHYEKVPFLNWVTWTACTIKKNTKLIMNLVIAAGRV